jgi:DNA polymerase I-like protein with 3'-5' exonuclease and polymerase domains
MKIYEVVPLAYAIRKVDPSKPVFMDTETDGLYGRVVLVQMMQESWEEALLIEEPDIILLREFVMNSHTVWHNASYDLSCLGIIPDKFDDTFMLAKLHFFKEEKFDLAAVYTYALRYDPYEEANLDKKVMQKTNWAGKLTDMHYTYAAIDVYYMPELWNTLSVAVDDANYRLDIITIKHCQKMEKNGLPLKPLRKLLADTIYELNTIENKLPVNPRSSQQVAKYLNMPDGTSADKLAKVISAGGERAENAQMVRTARELSKYKTTYLENMAGHNRWFGHFAPRTRSGRLASSDNNLQNLPRKLKSYIGFEPHQDRVLVSADFAQLEMRTIACIANDKKMMELFQANEDLHGYMANIIFGANYTKEQRQIAKVANFSLLYGAGAAKYVMILLQMTGIVISEAEAQQIKRKWLATFKGIAAWQQQGIKQWKAGNYHWTPMRRRYKAKMLNDYLNIENQGAGAEVSKLAFNYIMQKLPPEAKIVNFVHDSYLVDCPNKPEVYEEVAKILADSMQEAWTEYGKVVPRFKLVPMPVDCGVALDWKTAAEMSDECLYKLERK